MATKKAASKKGASTKRAAAPRLSQLQRRLNDDTRLRSQFLKDPGGVLRREGVELTPEKEQALAEFTQRVTAPAKQVSIDSIQQRTAGGAGARARVEVEVSVKVRF